MKQFLIEWCINLSIVILVVIYVGNFFLGCYLLVEVLDDNTLKGGNIPIFMGNILCSNYSNMLYGIFS